MPVEISIAQVMSLGVLCASVVFLLLLLVVGLYTARKAFQLASRFQSVGAERVNGRIQMRGLFHERSQAELIKVSSSGNLGDIKKFIKEAVDFEPSAEDLQRLAQVEQAAAGAGGEVN